jgi:2-polyprenyl-6-methoxyphenol hydroxylase-like FAD-dependent oxidoreductase
VVDIEQTNDSVIIKFGDGSIHETNFLIAADGIHSPIRKKLLPQTEPRYAGYTCWRAVIDNTHLNLSETSETWGTKGRFGISPLKDNKIYWYACINAPQNDASLKSFKVRDLQNHFKDFHAPIPEILSATKDENLIWNDIIDLKPIDHYAFGNIVLIGDAAHATTPNMGQGACQAIEDAVILADELQKDSNIQKAFAQFEQRRLKRTHYIVNRSWTIGKVAQLQNKTLASLRNAMFKLLPTSAGEHQLKRLYEVDF